MSRLAEFRKLEQQLAAQLAQLDSLKNDDGLKKDIEFETKLRDLLEQYGCSLKDVINILDPHSAMPQRRSCSSRESCSTSSRGEGVQESSQWRGGGNQGWESSNAQSLESRARIGHR